MGVVVNDNLWGKFECPRYRIEQRLEFGRKLCGDRE